MQHRLLLCLFLATCSLVVPVTGFLWDKEVEIVRSEWSSVVIVVRHVEYIGVIDNGTLDCSVPGFNKYRWTIINKATKESYAESYIMGSGDEKIPESQSKLKIGTGGFPLVNDMMVVSCEALVGLQPRMQIIWAITRLHSPFGYPTDPRVCDFGGKTYETNCTWYQWTYRTDCYYDKGLEYIGGVNYAKNNVKCKYWHMSTGIHHESHVLARYMGIFYKGGHDYCRNIPVNPTCYLKKRKVEPCKENILTQPWCYSDDDPDEKPLKVHYCDVKECSSCIYGNGDGTFKLYPKRKFPVYLGRGIKTTKVYKGNPVLCLQGIGWEDNICRTTLTIKTKSMDKLHSITKTTPHCYVAKPGADASKIKKVPDKNLELASCKFRQCTVRQVWFLFFNTYGQPFVVESNFKGIKLELVAGRKEERIKFAAFGIHLTDGFKIGSSDYGVSNYLGSFELKPRRPPDRLSELVVKDVKKQYKGKYFIEYKFIEADPKIEHSIYKVNLDIDVKEPTTFTLNPSVLRVCLKGDGKITVKINGYFSVLDDTIKWKYGTNDSSITADILPQNTGFELSANAKSLVLKTVTRELWVSVEGRSYSGITLATAKITLKDQPFLKAVSPLIQYALPGDDVTLMIEHNQLLQVTWVFDAIVIASLPDDPNMAFRRVARGDNLVTSLVISDVREHHYGNYYVESTLDGCKTVIKFEFKHSSENPEFGNLATSKPSITIAFKRTGLWCTDELDPYAFYFDVKFDSISTIGAFRNEPLTESKAVEIQHYSIRYSIDKIKWRRFIFKGNTSRIPYTFLKNEIHWLPVPMTAKYIRVYPENLDSIACMKVRFFGCDGKSLDCDGINRLKDTGLPLELMIGIPSGVITLVALIVIYLWKRKHDVTKKEEESKGKKPKRRRKRKLKEEDKDNRKRRPRKKREETAKDKDEAVPKKKRRRFTSSEESSFELDSEEEREIRRKAKMKAKKKEIEWEEKLRLKRKIVKQKKKERHENKEDSESKDDKSAEEKNKSENENKEESTKGKKGKERKKRSTRRRSSKGKKGKRSKRKDKDSSSKENIPPQQKELSRTESEASSQSNNTNST